MRVIIMLLLLIVLLAATLTVSAQVPAGVCPGPVNQALQALGTNCANLGRNTACYGFNAVDATFNVPVEPDFFTTTNERAELLIIDALRTGALNLINDEWGVSLMSVQANLPDALPGQGVVFVLLGGVEVEGDVEPEEAVVPEVALPVTVTAATDLRSAPNTPDWRASNILDNVVAGASASADAIDPTGGWVRVIYNDVPGWIDRATVAEDVSALTEVGPDSRTPMQAFFFRVGIGGVSCDEVPSVLAVQGPRNIAVDITVNEVNIRVTSTIILQSIPPGDDLGDLLQLSTISGMAIINPDTAEQIFVPPGYTIFIRLKGGDPESLGIEGDADEKQIDGEWFGLRPLTQEELEKLGLLENVPGNLLNYNIDIPTVTECSGEGGCEPQLVFQDQGALDGARLLCAQGLLPVDVCQYLGVQ